MRIIGRFIKSNTSYVIEMAFKSARQRKAVMAKLRGHKTIFSSKLSSNVIDRNLDKVAQRVPVLAFISVSNPETGSVKEKQFRGSQESVKRRAKQFVITQRKKGFKTASGEFIPTKK